MDYYIFKYIAALFAPLGGHELTIAVGKRKEEQGEYIFKASSQGLKVLDTLTNSVGEAMDLKTGGIYYCPSMVIEYILKRIWRKFCTVDLIIYVWIFSI